MKISSILFFALVFSACSAEVDQPKVLTDAQFEEVTNQTIPKKVQNLQDQIAVLDREWTDPEEAVYYAGMILNLKEYLRSSRHLRVARSHSSRPATPKPS